MTRPTSAALRRRLCLAATASAAPARAWPQAGGDVSALLVRQSDGTHHRATLDELKAPPAEPANLRQRDGAGLTVAGVSVTTLLRLVDLDLVRDLDGGQVVGQALVARVSAGSRAVHGLPLSDPHVEHPSLAVSWAHAEGSALAHHVGPLQLIATGETRARPLGAAARGA